MSIPFHMSPMGNYLLETAYVDFGAGNRFWFIVPPLSTDHWGGVQLELKLVNPTTANGAIFGYELNEVSRTFLRLNGTSWEFYTGRALPTYSFAYPAGSELSFSVNFTTRLIMVNGEQVASKTSTPRAWGSWCIGDCAYNADGTYPWGGNFQRNKMRLYSFKMWNNGTQLYDLQPMIDGTGKYWMLNKVDGTLLTRYEQA